MLAKTSPRELCSSGQQEDRGAPILVFPSLAGQSHSCPHLVLAMVLL